MAPPQWAYQVENFVTKPDEELICSICHSIFCNPVMSPCDHVFCKVCINKWLQNSRNCPICRKRVPRYSIKQIVPIVKNLIMKLTLYCRNRDIGCDSQFSLERCESHMKECNFEFVQCKNKPCKEKLLRKDLEEHETKGCPHRYIKCISCGSKMSLLANAEAHNCVSSLQMRLKRKIAIIHKKNDKIKELKEEIKNLKEAPTSTLAQSSISSANVSPEMIQINIAESLTSDSDDSSDSFITFIANNESFSTDGNQSAESFERFMDSLEDNHYESPVDSGELSTNLSQTNDDLVNDSLNRNNSSSEHNSAEQDQISEPEERPHRRRPHKRRLPPLYSSSEEEDELEERQLWSSPKRPWLSSSAEVQNKTPENGGGNSGDSVTEPGTSASYSVDLHTSGEESASSSQSQTNKEQVTRTAIQTNFRIRKAKPKTKTSRGRAVFESTLALLEQYNLESDPEWLPEYASHRGDTPSPSESESSYDDLDVLNDSSSSSSDMDPLF